MEGFRGIFAQSVLARLLAKNLYSDSSLGGARVLN